MNNIVKYLAYGLGGLTLLSGSFFLFAALSGTPIGDLRGVGDVLSNPSVDAVASIQDLDHPEDELEADQRSPAEVLASAQSPLELFVLPSPFTAGELEALELQLQNRMRELELRERGLDELERELEEDRQRYEELFLELENLRNGLIEANQEQMAREEEIDRDQAALAEQERQSYVDLAKLYADRNPQDMALMLTGTLKPDKAALILTALPEEEAGAILGEIFKIDPELSASYQEAFRKVGAQR